MAEKEGYYFEDLVEGMTETYTKTITDADLRMFADVTGDDNPVHFNDEYAEGTRFKGRIAHGMLVTSLISTILGMKLPGAGTINLEQSFRFKAPVRPGDTVTARVTVKNLLPEKKFVELGTDCMVGETVVVSGQATVMVPSRG